MNKYFFRIAAAVLFLLFSSIACSLFSSLGNQVRGVQETAAAVATGVQQGQDLISTVQSVATQAEGSGLVKTIQAVATNVEKSGLGATIEAVATESGPGLIQTAQAFATEQGPGLVETAQALATQLASSAGNSQSDIPVVDAATVSDLKSSDSYVYYTTTLPVKTVVDFYKNEMPVNGWEKVAAGSIESENTALLNFSKSGKTAAVAVNSSSSETTTVMISIQGK
jgi:hypothetical protein